MYTGNILDPIHGLIKLSEIEKWVIAQKPFNRLKRIKQNTFLYLVFPSSNHTRFEHSLGVMHLAHQIYVNSNINYSTGNYKKEKYGSKDNSDFKFCSTSELLKEEENILIQELRLAALLHDVGHGPMSHKFDQYTLNGIDLIKIVDNDPDLANYSDNFKLLIKNENKKVEHEVVSCLFIIKILSDLKKISTKNPKKFSENENQIIERLNVARIIKMIEPEFCDEKIILNKVDFTDFFNSIISSFPLDADRMDYLYRDSYFSGVKYGIYDLSRVLMSFIPVIQENKVTLCIKESGIDSIIRFIQSRTHLFNQVYFHKTNRSANMMLDFACRGITAKKQSIISANNYEELEKFYWKNSDEMFLWNTLSDNITQETEKEVLEELLLRKLWKRVFQHKIVIIPTDKRNILRTLKNIKSDINDAVKKLEESNIYIAVDNFPNIVFKDVEKSKIKIAQKNNDEYILKDNWPTFNKELQILKCEVHMFRIYLRRQFTSPKHFTSLKNEILNVFDPIINKLKSLGD